MNISLVQGARSPVSQQHDFDGTDNHSPFSWVRKPETCGWVFTLTLVLTAFLLCASARAGSGIGLDFTQMLPGESFTEQYSGWRTNDPDLQEELVEVDGQTALRLHGPNGIVRTITNEGGPLSGKVSLLVDFSFTQGAFGAYGIKDSERIIENLGSVGFVVRPNGRVIFPSGNEQQTLPVLLLPGQWYRCLMDIELSEDPLVPSQAEVTIWELTPEGASPMTEKHPMETGWPEGDRPTSLSGLGFGIYPSTADDEAENFVYRAVLVPSDELPESLRNGQLNPLQAP